jgi:serine/threonine-protein kinase
MAEAPHTIPSHRDSGPGGADAADLTGRMLGEFLVLRRLGQGGMGQVYLAEQVSLKRKVALKVLRADLAAKPTFLQRFKAEAEAVARATHANIVQVYAIGECAGLHYMALEYVEGRNLRDFVARKGPPELLLALSIMRQAAAALQRAAELGIIHRDIKPENILLTRKGEVKVADFGLSRCLAEGEPLNLTQSGVTLGTPLYMSPEQVQGKAVDARTDIYSLGVTCYHMLTGQPPFRGESPYEVALQHVNAEPVPLATIRPDLPPELCAVVHRMMAKEPAHRYQTGRDLLKDLVRLRESQAAAGPHQTQPVSLGSIASLPAAPTSPGGGGAQRGRWLPAAVPLSLVLAVAVGAGAALLLRQARSAAPAAAASGPEQPAEETFKSLQRREQFLKEAVEQRANPGEDKAQLRLGLGDRIELGLFYLDQWRLEEADQFFSRLAGNPKPPAYHALGVLGHAVVLGLRNQPDRSNMVFLELLGSGQAAAEHLESGLLKPNPRLREWVARALDYNAANLPPDQFPPGLSRLRQAGGNDKPSGKKP